MVFIFTYCFGTFVLFCLFVFVRHTRSKTETETQREHDMVWVGRGEDLGELGEEKTMITYSIKHF